MENISVNEKNADEKVNVYLDLHYSIYSINLQKSNESKNIQKIIKNISINLHIFVFIHQNTKFNIWQYSLPKIK